MLKALFVSSYWTSQTDLEELNKELKNCKSIIKEISCLDGVGTILIADIFSRKDKLEKLNNISNEKGINNNSV